MAHRKKSGVDGIGALIVLAFIFAGTALMLAGMVLVSAAVYAPLLLLIALLVYQAKAAAANPPDEPTPEDFAHLARLEKRLASDKRRRQQIEDEGKAADLLVNMDGSFDRRSKLGKRLNIEKEELSRRIPELESVTRKMREAPLANFYTWLRIQSMSSALKRTLVVYLGLIIILYFVASGPWRKLSAFAVQNVLLHVSGIDEAVYGSALISGPASILVLLLLYSSRKHAIATEHIEFAQRWVDFANSTNEPEVDEEEAAETQSEADDTGRAWRENSTNEQRESDLREPSDEHDRSWFEVLDVSPFASPSEINSAYRAKMLKNHPDRVADLDPKLQEFASTLAKELNRAREAGLRARS